jgi:hypothetical protein
VALAAGADDGALAAMGVAAGVLSALAVPPRWRRALLARGVAVVLALLAVPLAVDGLLGI